MIVGVKESVEQRRAAITSQTLASHRLVKVCTDCCSPYLAQASTIGECLFRSPCDRRPVSLCRIKIASRETQTNKTNK